jgi:Na+/melibiose symporter-like transporter
MCLTLLFLYVYVFHNDRKLGEANDISELSSRTIRFIMEKDFSKEKILENLKMQEARLIKYARPIRISFVAVILYFAMRVVTNSISVFYLGRKLDFPKLSDYIVFLSIDLLLLIVVARRILILSFNRRISDLPRLLVKRDNKMEVM